MAGTRKLLKEVAKELHEEVTRVSSEYLLDLCQRLRPSTHCESVRSLFNKYSNIHLTQHVVQTGGQLLEHYMEGLSGFVSHQEWIALKAAVKREGAAGKYTNEAEETLIKREVGGFHGFVMKSCAGIGNTGKRQLFWTTFVARYHGLSRMGTELLSHYDFTTARTQYQAMKLEVLKQARAQTR